MLENLIADIFGGISTPAVQPGAAPVTITSAAAIPGLAAAIAAAAPHANIAIWSSALTPWLTKATITTPRRVAALLGQCAVEAGPGFSSLRENLNYTHAERLCAVYPREFPSVAAAEPYVGNPSKLACRVYAGRLGNGDEASGDGGKFCGRGLLQITGRDAYTPFANWCGKSIDDAAIWAETPDGAAASACWYWSTNGLNGLADGWQLSGITRRINGPAMEGNAQRIAASNAALHAMGSS